MRFAFTEDQLAFRDAVADLLEKECPPQAVRAAWENETGRTDQCWDALGEMGVLGALAPEAAGGLGLTELDLVLLLEASGRAALPEPLVEHAMVAAPIVPTSLRTVTAALGPSPLVPYAELRGRGAGRGRRAPAARVAGRARRGAAAVGRPLAPRRRGRLGRQRR